MSDSLEFLDAIARIANRITRNDDGTFNLDCAAGNEIGISEAIFMDLSKSLQRTNELIRSGDIAPEAVKIQ